MVPDRKVQWRPYGQAIEYLRLDLCDEQQKPCAQELEICIAEVVLDVSNFADQDHVQHAQQRDKSEDNPNLRDKFVLDHCSLVLVLWLLLQVSHRDVEDGAQHAHEDEGIDTLYSSVGQRAHVSPRFSLCILRGWHIDILGVLQKARAEEAKHHHSIKLESNGELEIHGVCCQLQPLYPVPILTWMPATTRHHSPNSNKRAHRHDYKDQGHANDDNHPLKPLSQFPRQITSFFHLPRMVELNEPEQEDGKTEECQKTSHWSPQGELVQPVWHLQLIP
mmetsp:Transcript_38936/g.70262  ORF Transcript_38936/g.70262 Transcript_38936/m.70262 type:complete len:277 (+) Transcript_38936:326-1156(+)